MMLGVLAFLCIVCAGFGYSKGYSNGYSVGFMAGLTNRQIASNING